MWTKIKDIRHSEHDYVLKNNNPHEPITEIHVFRYPRNTYYSLSVSINDSWTRERWETVLSKQIMATLNYSEYNTHCFFFTNIDKRFLANVLNALVMISPQLSHHIANLCGVLSVDLHNAYSEIPSWIKSKSCGYRNKTEVKFINTCGDDANTIYISVNNKNKMEVTVFAKSFDACDEIYQRLSHSETIQEKMILAISLEKKIRGDDVTFLNDLLKIIGVKNEFIQEIIDAVPMPISALIQAVEEFSKKHVNESLMKKLKDFVIDPVEHEETIGSIRTELKALLDFEIEEVGELAYDCLKELALFRPNNNLDKDTGEALCPISCDVIASENLFVSVTTSDHFDIHFLAKHIQIKQQFTDPMTNLNFLLSDQVRIQQLCSAKGINLLSASVRRTSLISAHADRRRDMQREAYPLSAISCRPF